MKRTLLIALLVATLLAGTQCSSTRKLEASAYPIGYVELQNYFAIADDGQKQPLRLVIDDQATFDAHFGPAATMGAGGRPTPIDFRKQFVLAVLLPPTNRSTIVIPGEISQVDGTIIFNYTVRKGQKQSYTVLPFTAVAIDKPEATANYEFIFKQK